MAARRNPIMRRRRHRRDGSLHEPDPDEPPVVVGVTLRTGGLSGNPSRWGIAAAAVAIGCLDVIALAVIVVHAG